ncbi:CEP192 [Branchiostoma lanceolatum]|uniref:CEP192 protein n=1 Tax=Branchiostoma lanceolatum TaxID=7740 RepID=A0A8S4MMJ6_BRALA|nr:CEP192 [Branchiostoma lanceolatum]
MGRISGGSELGSNTTDMSIFSHRDSSILPLDNFDLLEEELDRMNQTQDEDEDGDFLRQNGENRKRAPDSPPHIASTAEPTELRRLSSGDGEERLSAGVGTGPVPKSSRDDHLSADDYQTNAPRGARGPATGKDSAEESEIDTEDELEAVRREMASREEYLTKGLDRVGVGESGESNGNGKLSSRPELLGQNSEGVSPLDSMRQSAEGDVVTSPVPGDGGGGGDGSSGNSSDDNRPVQIAGGQVTLDVLRGLGVMPAPQARRPSQGSTRDAGEADVSDPVRESIPGHEEVERMGPVGSGGGDPPDVRGVHFASMDEYRQISRTSSLSSHSQAQQDSREGWDQEKQQGNGQPSNNETGDQTSLLASKFFLPTSRPSTDSAVNESATGPWTHDASSFHLSELHASGRDRTSAEQGEHDDTLVGLEKEFGDGEEQEEEDLAGHQDVENPFDNEEDLNWRSAGDFGLENGALKGLDNPFGAVRSSLGSFGLEQGEDDPDGNGALVGDITFSQKVSFGEAEFSQLVPGSPRSSAGDRSNSRTGEQANSSQQAEGTPPFDHVIVSKCKQLPGEVNEPSPVYIDENGQGVTNLAFHPDNPFDDVPQDGLEDEFGEQDFVAAEEAKDMLAEDEAKFEKENVFAQGDNMATPAAGTVGLGEWSVPTGSQFVVVQDSFSGEEPFMRISIGTFIGQRTEALGALGEEGDLERPHFGRTIVTPPSNRMPVALIRLSEVSQDQGPRLAELLEDGSGDAGKGAGGAGKGLPAREEEDDLDSTIRFSGVGDYAPEQDDSLYLHDETLTPGYHPEDETPFPERARAKPRIKLLNDDTIVIETTQEAMGQTRDTASDMPRARHAAEKTTPVSRVPKTKDGADKKGHQAKPDQADPAVEQKRTQQKLQGTKPADDKAKDETRRSKTEPDSLAAQNKDVTTDDISVSDKTMDASCAGPNISSIASAIVNASVSDDPTKLADMILKLSEKTSKGRDRKKAPKQASSVKPVGLGQHKVPGSQVPKESVKGSVYKPGGGDYRPPAKHLPVSNVNKVNERREKDPAKELLTKKQPSLVGQVADKKNESGTLASSDTSKLGSPTKQKSRIPVKQRDSSKTKSPTKVSFLDRSENADDGVGSRVQKPDMPYSVNRSFGAAGKKGDRSNNLNRDLEFEGPGQPSTQKSAATDIPAFPDSVQGIPGDSRHSRKAVVPGTDGSTKEFSQTRGSRLKADHSGRPNLQDDSVNIVMVKDMWETMEPILRTREHSPGRKTGTQSSAKDRPSIGGQESVAQNNLSFSVKSNYDVDIKYNFDVRKEDVAVEGWPSRSKDKTSGSKTLFRERSPIRDRSPIKSPRRSTSPGFDASKEHGHAKRDSHHGKGGRRTHSPQNDFHSTHPKPDRDSDLLHDHRKSSTEAPQKQTIPLEVRQSNSNSRPKTNGFDFDAVAPIRKPKKEVKLHKCILPGIEIEPEPTVPRKTDGSQRQAEKSSPKVEADAERHRMKDPSKVQPSMKKNKADSVPEKDSRRRTKDFDVSLSLPPGVTTNNEDDNILSPRAEDLDLHLKMANLRTRGDKTSPTRSAGFGAPLSPTRPPVSPTRDSIASVHSTIQPSASSTPQSPSSPGKTRSRIELSQTFGDSTTFNFSPDDTVSSLSSTLSHVSPTPGRAEASVMSIQDTPGETLHTRMSGTTLVESPSVSVGPSPGRPMITPFQAYPQTSSVATTSTTPTLLTSRSLFTNPVAVQYLQSRPVSGMGGHTATVPASGMQQHVSGMGGHTTTVAASGMPPLPRPISGMGGHTATVTASGIQQPYTYPPQSAPPYPGMYPPPASLHPAYPPGMQQYQPYPEGMAAPAYPPTTQYQQHPAARLPYGAVPHVGMGIPGPPPSSLHGGMPTVPSSSTAPNAGMISEDPQQGMLPVAPSRTSGSRASATPTEDVSYRVIAPAEVRFPGVCCVGIGIQALLPLHNPTSRWLQCALHIMSINANGEQQMMPGADNIFHLKQKTIIGPHTTEEIKVLFTPHHPGVYVAQVQVSSCLVLANSEDAAVIDHMPSIVNVQAIAEKPFIQVTAGESDALNFGDLPGSSTVCLPIKLTNHTRANVPVRLILSATSAMWHCFSFKDSRRESGSSTAVYHCTLQGKSDQQLSDPAIVIVQFRAPEKQVNTSGPLGPPDEYTGRVDIEMDTPGTTSPIASVPMKARVGVARIHTPRTLQALVLTTSIGTSISRSVPLKNAGNIPVTVDLSVAKQQDVFTLLPSTLTLHPGQQSEVTVKFAPKHAPHTVSSLMTMCVRPGGPQYEVLLRGECVMLEKKQHVAAEAPPVLSNKQFLSWGGVPMGRALQQKLVLRNSSQTQTLKLDLTIRDDGNGCFQLQSSFMEHEQLSSSRQIILKPLEDFPVHLIFAPTRVATMQAKLVIKPPKGNTKFTIPLSGYGGTCNLTVEGLRAVSDMYIANLGEVSVGKKSTIDIPVRNTGSRAAFVKAMCFGDLSARTQLPANRVRIEPSEFVLRERTTKVISVVFHISEKEEAICAERADTVGTLGLFYGDEISRKQLRRALRKGCSERGLLADTNPLKGVNFDMEYLGEEHAQEGRFMFIHILLIHH